MVKNVVFVYIVTMCLIGFFQMYIDKKRAKKHDWRISETTLLMTAALGGSFGSFLGMRLFRHKTKHPRFYILIPVFMVIHAVILFYFFTYM